MKIILSRKGLDGGFKEAKPSPILPCGRLLSLPIPVTKEQKKKGEKGIPYDDVRFDGQSIREIIDQLYNHNHRFPYNEAHLDPDIDRERYAREEGWRPVFGQKGGAQGHLHNQGVGIGDLFLFFGWFRRTRYENARLKYVPPRKGGNDLHVIFGWLRVGEILEVQKGKHQDEFPMLLHYHPHIVNRNIYPNNRIYVAADHLTLDGLSVRGAGTFPCFKSSLQLTAPEEKSRSYWSLPKWLCREQNYGNWPCHEDHVPFNSYSNGRRQEFVFDVPEPDSQETIKWLKGLFEDCC